MTNVDDVKRFLFILEVLQSLPERKQIEIYKKICEIKKARTRQNEAKK